MIYRDIEYTVVQGSSAASGNVGVGCWRGGHGGQAAIKSEAVAAAQKGDRPGARPENRAARAAHGRNQHLLARLISQDFPDRMLTGLDYT
jgi:hypothetical protein